jgi:hypothetical protein
MTGSSLLLLFARAQAGVQKTIEASGAWEDHLLP